MRLSVVIPVYNEAATIEEIVRRVRAVPLDIELVVVDDGSTDGTRERLAAIPGIDRLLLHERNLGKGAALRTGLAVATGDAVVFQDADLEYDPRDLVRLLDRLARDATPVVYGSRILGQNAMSHLSFYLGGRTLTALVNLLFGTRLTDEPTCYKMLRREVLEEISLESAGFEVCVELTAKVARLGHAIVEVPIHYAPRRRSEGKKIRLRDGWPALRTLLREWLRPVPAARAARIGATRRNRVAAL
jgi:glycosyltransferase involved in cell wall biosynthesis